MRICRNCGTIAARIKTECKQCGGAIGEAQDLRVEPLPDDLLWARVQATLKCRSCGFAFSLDHLELGGSVRCSSCGMVQAFDPTEWEEMLEFVHQVVDFTGDRLPSRKDRRWFFMSDLSEQLAELGPRVGRESTQLSCDSGSSGGLEWEIGSSPGHPLCESCHTPMAVNLEPPQRAHVRCPQCSLSKVFELPEGVSRVPSVRAVLAPHHEAGYSGASERESSGDAPRALTCPHCQAPLSAPTESEILTCSYCGGAVQVPRGQSGGTSGSVSLADAPAWWILFEGRSILGVEVERAVRKENVTYEKHVRDIDVQMAEAAVASARTNKILIGALLGLGALAIVAILAFLML